MLTAVLLAVPGSGATQKKKPYLARSWSYGGFVDEGSQDSGDQFIDPLPQLKMSFIIPTPRAPSPV